MEIIVHLEIGKKGHENNKNWEITKIEDGGWKKKVVCKTARRAHSQKKYDKTNTWSIVQVCVHHQVD